MDNLYAQIYNKARDGKFHNSDCDIVKVEVKKKRLWYTLWIKVKKKYKYYCGIQIDNQINKIIKDLSLTKKYFNQKLDNLIDNYNDKINSYLDNYINIANNLFDNLYNYTEIKKQNTENILPILKEYQNISNKI